MEKFTVGDVVKSTAGHDKNKLFVVISIDKTGKIAIIDCKYRCLNNPTILQKINDKSSTNAEIHKLIKNQFKE